MNIDLYFDSLAPLFSLVKIPLSLIPAYFWITVAVFGTLLALVYWRHKRRFSSKVKTSSPKQREAQIAAIKALEAVRKASGAKEAMEVVAKLNGFEFEIFVLEVFAATERRIRRFDRLKLTGDGGVDGAFLLEKVWYVVQSKHYKGAVRTGDIRAIGQVAERYKHSKHPYAVKKRKRLGYQDVKALFVTSGAVTSSGSDEARCMGVRIIHLDDLIAAARGKSVLFA